MGGRERWGKDPSDGFVALTTEELTNAFSVQKPVAESPHSRRLDERRPERSANFRRIYKNLNGRGSISVARRDIKHLIFVIAECGFRIADWKKAIKHPHDSTL